MQIEVAKNREDGSTQKKLNIIIPVYQQIESLFL